MEVNRQEIEGFLEKNGFDNYRWLDPKTEIFVEHWPRLKCQFGCSNYGVKGACPPLLPPIDEVKAIMQEYDHAVLIRHEFVYPDDDIFLKQIVSVQKRVVALERDVFLAGYYKTFLMMAGSCALCKTCTAEGTREKCKQKMKARPGPDAMGIDMYKTVRNAGYELNVVVEYGSQNQHSILLVD